MSENKDDLLENLIELIDEGLELAKGNLVEGSSGCGKARCSSKLDFIAPKQKRTDYIRRAVAERILELCNKKGYTVNQLSRISGISQSTVSDVVKCKSKNVGIVTLYRLCVGLNINLEDFFSDELFRW